MSEELTFDGRLEPETVVLEVAVGDTPGQVTVRATGADIGMPAEVVFSPAQMRQIATDVEFMADFDPDKLELSWQVGGLCGFGPGDPPIGSKSLENPPSWWAPTTLDPASDPALVRDFFGVSCDSFNDEKSGWPVGDESISRSLFRHIYGFGGWVDCAVTTCWLELGVTWTYPMPDGSTLGSDMPVARAIVDVEADWPSARPNIQILEPGPYSPGQDVTVEVTDHPLRSDGLGIGWCPGGDGYCRYHFSTYLDGVHRVTWRIPGESSDCGTNRCYFEVESQSEGLAPPAIVVVPIVGT